MRPTRVLRLLAMVVVAIWIYFPIYFMCISALKSKGAIYSYPPQLFSTTFLLFSNFISALNPNNYYDIHWDTTFAHSFGFALGGAAVALLLGVPLSFALAHFDVRAKYLLLFNFLTLRFLPAVVIILPLYILWQNLHLLDTGASIILEYGIFGLPWVIWLMWSFFEGVPHSVYESAQVDGASNTTILLRVMLPAVYSGLLVAGIFAFLQGYNDYQVASLIGGAETITVPVALSDSIGQSFVAWNVIYSVGLLNFLPAVALAFLVRKHWARALSFGLVK